MQELSAESHGAAHVLGAGHQRDLSTSQALQGTALGPSTLTPFSLNGCWSQLKLFALLCPPKVLSELEAGDLG